jgi:hypothetical protein
MVGEGMDVAAMGAGAVGSGMPDDDVPAVGASA